MEENKNMETEQEVKEQVQEEVEDDEFFENDYVEVEPEPAKKKGFWPTKEQVLHGLKVVGTITAAFAAGAAATVMLGVHLANQKDQLAITEKEDPEKTE